MAAKLNLLSWNASGLMSSSAYLCDVLKKRNIDFCGISEHWLRKSDLHFFNHLDSNYDSHVVNDRDLEIPGSCYVRKGGVAIMWKRQYSSRVAPLSIEDDRIIGVQFESSKDSYMYVFQVYFPSSNHPISKYREYVDKLSDLLNVYSLKGVVVVMGDINGHIESFSYKTSMNERGRCVKNILDNHGYISVNTTSMCTGARSTFVSYNGGYESLIDHIIISSNLLNEVEQCEILEDSSLNVSTHRPVFCVIRMPVVRCQGDKDEPRLKWDRVSTQTLHEYEKYVQDSTILSALMRMRISTRKHIDHAYTMLVQCLREASDMYIPKASFRRHLKPYWNEDLTCCRRSLNVTRDRWVASGKPRDNESPCYSDYKHSKSTFRKVHRRAVDDYMKSLNCAIEESAELDSRVFWGLVNARRNRSVFNSGNEMIFDGEICRNAEQITKCWGTYYKNLYSKSENPIYDETHFNEISEKVQNISCRFLQEESCTDEQLGSYITVELIDSLLKKCKKSKAPGFDKVAYEHLIYGGAIIRQLLVKLFTAMLRMSHIPDDMKKGIIITLYKGGNKIRTDPNSYRAITLSSVFVRLYESVLLHKLDLDGTLTFSKLQCGFQKNLGCLMTSFALRECIQTSIEHNSKVFVCFLDAKQAFDRVWHSGLFSKLFDADIDKHIFKAFFDMYTGLQSRVKFRGFKSDWFPVLQGTRQGGVSSPKLYLLYIDGLIKEIEQSGLGLCIYGTCFASPTVADDMCLVSYSKTAMDKMMNICFQYSCRWRFDYNARKCAVVVFNEGRKDVNCRRKWCLGPEEVPEKVCYTHLGIDIFKDLNIDNCIAEAKKKITCTFFGLVGCGRAEDGIHPLTLLNIYKSVVIPKGLYGCELWNDMSDSHILTLEQAQRKCVRFAQGIPSRTRSDIALGMVGCKLIESEIDYRKLSFFGQLCNLNGDYLVKRVFIDRLVRYDENHYRKRGFIPDIYKLLCKYQMANYFQSYISAGIFPSKYQWKRILRCSIRKYEVTQRQVAMGRDLNFAPYLENIVDVLTPVPIWLLCKECPQLLKDCQKTVKLLSWLYSIEFIQMCDHCGDLFVNKALHVVFDCAQNECARQKFWKDIYTSFGCSIYVSLVKLDQKSQIVNLCFGLCQLLISDEARVNCLKLCVNTFSNMLT